MTLKRAQSYSVSICQVFVSLHFLIECGGLGPAMLHTLAFASYRTIISARKTIKSRKETLLS